MQSKQKAGLRQLPMMPIRDVVIFPHMMTPFVVGRESSVLALEEALNTEKKIFLATQHDASVDDPTPDQIYQVGTIVSIVQSLKLPDGNIKVLVEGVERARLHTVTQQEGFYRATVKVYPARPVPSEKTEALNSRVTSSFEHYVKQSQNLNYETMIAAVRVDDPGKLADTVGANLQLTIPEKQDLLEIFDPIDRLTRVAEVLDIELEKLNVDRTIQNRVKRQMEKAQKEYYLNEKIKAIQKELGKGEKGEYEELRKKIEDAGIVSFIDLTEEDKHAPYDRLLEVAEYRRFPIKDYDIPESNEHTIAILTLIDDNLRNNRPTYIHCYGGRGRTGTIIGCWLARHGHEGEAALKKLRELWAENPKSERGLQTPETPEQEQYIVEWKE